MTADPGIAALAGLTEPTDPAGLAGLDGAPEDPGAVDWERWEDAADRSCRAFYLSPGQAGLATLLRTFTAAQRSLTDRSGATSDPGRSGFRVLAKLGALVGISLAGFGEYGEAEDWYRTAAAAAEHAGDPVLRTWIRCHHALTPLLYQSAGLALARIRTTAAAAGDRLDLGTVWVAVTQARIRGRMHQAPAAREALRRAEDGLERLHQSFATDSMYGFNEHFLRWNEAHVHAYAGDPERALLAVETATRLCPPANLTGLTLLHQERVLCLAAAGETESACRSTQALFADLVDEARAGIPQAGLHDLLRLIPVSHRRRGYVADVGRLLLPRPGDPAAFQL